MVLLARLEEKKRNVSELKRKRLITWVRDSNAPHITPKFHSSPTQLKLKLHYITEADACCCCLSHPTFIGRHNKFQPIHPLLRHNQNLPSPKIGSPPPPPPNSLSPFSLSFLYIPFRFSLHPQSLSPLIQFILSFFFPFSARILPWKNPTTLRCDV